MTTATKTLPAAPNSRLARYLTYPAILLANAGVIVWALVEGVELGGVTLAALLGSVGLLFLLERAMPYEREWHPDGKEGLRDLIYFGLNGGLDALGKMGIAIVIAAVGVWNNGLPFWAGLPLAILVTEFFGYWLHRFGHHGWLWKVHGVHHTPDKVNTWNNNTIHFLNSIYGTVGKTLPLMLLGFDADVVIIAAFISTLQSFAVHANIDVELGALGYLIMGPAHHRLHHSTRIEEAGNYASALTLWDILFGTFTYVPGKNPEAVGVVDPSSFPPPNAVLANQLHPFVPKPEA